MLSLNIDNYNNFLYYAFMTTYSIYVIENDVNDLKYVGITQYSLKRRFTEHKRKVKRGIHTKLYNAMRQFGVDKFHIRLLENDIPFSDGADKECYYINLFNSFNNGYNMTLGGKGVVGYKFTDDVRKKISLNSLRNAQMYTPERNLKISLAQRGVPKTKEHCQKLSLARLGKFKGCENSFYGKHHTSESIQKIRVGKKSKAVQRLSLNGDILMEYVSVGEAAEWVKANKLTAAKMETCRGLIAKVCKGMYDVKSCYGFCWCYKKV